MNTSQVAVIGSYNTDLTTFTPRIPKLGETILGNGFKTGPGGKGSNQAVAAARLGARVVFIGGIGQDMFGEMALSLWQEEGIDVRHVIHFPEEATGVATIMVDEQGENIIVVASGANWAITPAHVDRAADAIAASRVLLAQLETPLPVVTQALRIARQHGVLTLLNPAPAQRQPKEMLDLVDIITPNQTEAEILTGIPAANPEDAARMLRQQSGCTVVMTLGGEGVLVYDENGPQRFPAFRVDAVKDTTGAGDAFNGALAVALAEGQPLAQAIPFASATGALSVTRPGATESMPTRAEVEAML